MYFNEIEIENYKCFKDKVTLKLKQGINVIVGKNNVGKTALLEALSLQSPHRPHYSLETYPKADQEPLSRSKTVITLTLDKDELITLLLMARQQGDVDFRLPLDKNYKSESDGGAFKEAAKEARGRVFGKSFFHMIHSLLNSRVNPIVIRVEIGTFSTTHI